jgi:Rad3-related DNA helicase
MLQILFISPERLFSESFFSAMDGLPQISLAVVDEAHCLSEWYVESEESRNKPFICVLFICKELALKHFFFKAGLTQNFCSSRIVQK